MAFLFKPPLKILYSVHRRIHLPAQLCFDAMKQFRDLLEADITNNHNVYITFGTGLPRSNRPVYECDLDVIPNGFENSSKCLDHTNSLDQDLLEFLEDWGLPSSLVVNAVSIPMSFQQSCFSKCCEIALDTRRLQMKLTGELPEVPPFVRLENCGRKKGLFGSCKQRI